MKMSSRGHYGLRAMAQLALSYGHGPLALSEIARAEGLSLAYLEQIVAALRRSGLVEGSRGVHGGYELTRPPAEISAGEILRVLEGPFLLAACVGDGAVEGNCGRQAFCTTKSMWLRLRDSIAGVLDSTSLADLCREVEVTTASPQTLGHSDLWRGLG